MLLRPLDSAGVAEPKVKASVLVVDDHALLRTGVANIINQEPDLIVVAEAANGVEAVAAFETYHPDVTLLDLRMPEMEGVEAVRQIRDRDPQAKVIILTTYDTDEDITCAPEGRRQGPTNWASATVRSRAISGICSRSWASRAALKRSR